MIWYTILQNKRSTSIKQLHFTKDGKYFIAPIAESVNSNRRRLRNEIKLYVQLWFGDKKNRRIQRFSNFFLLVEPIICQKQFTEPQKSRKTLTINYLIQFKLN